MRIGFNSPAIPGHLNPMTVLARELQRRGHEVVFFTSFLSEPAIRAADLRSFPFRERYFRPDNSAERFATLSALQGREALACAFEMIADASRELIEDGPRMIKESGVDALVLDSLWRNLDLVAMHLDVPYVHVSLALHQDFIGVTPFWAYDWSYETGPEAQARNLKGLFDLAPLVAPCEAVTREYVQRVGLRVNVDDPYFAFSRLAQITQTPRVFDFPGDHWPAHFHYTGPLHDGHGRVPVAFPWERLTGEPLIYASMGTLNNGSESAHRAIIDAVCSAERQLVLSVGNNVDPAPLEPVPSNTIIVAHAPQLELLKKATLCITHAGQNTVLEALAQGVPLIAIPVANDQPGVAARVAYTKTGKFVPFAQLSAQKLRSLVDEVLTEPLYRENAQTMGDAIRRLNGPSLAADIIENAFSCRISPSASS
jgi:zeaxanthin glucosyltransferase